MANVVTVRRVREMVSKWRIEGSILDKGFDVVVFFVGNRSVCLDILFNDHLSREHPPHS